MNQRMNLNDDRRKECSVPLTIDCSVEYELPNSAKPPIGIKNEPLLMIHPLHYIQEENKRPSGFINNLPNPKKQNIIRPTQSTHSRGLKKSIILEVKNDYRRTRGRKNVSAQPLYDDPAILEARASDFLHAITNISQNVPSVPSFQPLTPMNSANTTPEVPQLDYYPSPFWQTRRSNQILCVPQSQAIVHEVSEIPITTHIPVRDDLSPITPSTATGSDKPWPKARYSRKVERVCRVADPKCHIPTQDRSKKHFCNNKDNITSRVSKGIPVKKNPTYSGTSTISINSAAKSVIANLGLGAKIYQQQPAVGVAAIAPTTLNTLNTLNYYRYSPSMTSATVEDDRELISNQPWSATIAPEFPSSSLPCQVFKRSLIETACPEVPPQLSSTRKRTSGYTSWNCNGYRNKDSSLNGQNRNLVFEHNLSYKCPRLSATPAAQMIERLFEETMPFNSPSCVEYGSHDSSLQKQVVGVNENAQNYDGSWNTCTVASSREQPDLYSNYSNNCATTENTAIESGIFLKRLNPDEDPFSQPLTVSRTFWKHYTRR